MACWAAVMMVSGCELGLGIGRLGHLAEHFLRRKEEFVRGDFKRGCDFSMLERAMFQRLRSTAET